MVRFTLTDKKLSMQEYFDLVKYLSKNLCVGVEMERPISRSPDEVGRILQARGNRMNAQNEDGLQEYKVTSGTPFNVVYCYRDGSVYCRNGQSGVEVVFGGTNENMRWIYDRLLLIEKRLDEMGAEDYHYTCSNHMTLITLQDRPIKSVVLRNLWNLARAYGSALYWLSSADKQTLVRQRRNGMGGCRENASMRYNMHPYGTTFRTTERYTMLNMTKQQFINDDMNGVMLEFRNPDGMRVPSATASLMVMYRAMLMKALDLSLMGVIEIEGAEFDENVRLSDKITGAGLRDTKLSPQDAEKVVRQAKELIALLTPQLKAHSPEAIPVLYKLCEKPVSFRSGRWATINSELFKANHNLTDNEKALIEIVVSHGIVKDTATKWKKHCARTLRLSERMVEHMMSRITEKTQRAFVYEKELGSFVMRG